MYEVWAVLEIFGLEEAQSELALLAVYLNVPELFVVWCQTWSIGRDGPHHMQTALLRACSMVTEVFFLQVLIMDSMNTAGNRLVPTRLYEAGSVPPFPCSNAAPPSPLWLCMTLVLSLLWSAGGAPALLFCGWREAGHVRRWGSKEFAFPHILCMYGAMILRLCIWVLVSGFSVCKFSLCHGGFLLQSRGMRLD